MRLVWHGNRHETLNRNRIPDHRELAHLDARREVRNRSLAGTLWTFRAGRRGCGPRLRNEDGLRGGCYPRVVMGDCALSSVDCHVHSMGANLDQVARFDA